MRLQIREVGKEEPGPPPIFWMDENLIIFLFINTQSRFVSGFVCKVESLQDSTT